jgi:hypothetical protein
MSHFSNSTLLQLWNLAGGDPTDASSDWNVTFDPIGLILFAPPRNEGYWCTPLNSLTFATTGGDSVHYSLLATNDEFTDLSPVVMTIPMCDTPNMIVGANLEEFLALGCRFGYFALEQLVYKRHATLQELALARFDPETGQGERLLLQRIASSFNLVPWTNPESRLAELDMLFTSSLQLPPENEIAT